MLSPRSALGYVLWRIGLRPVLPRQVIHAVPIVECGQPLVPASASPRLLLHPVAGAGLLLREDALRRLNAAAERLPDDLRLVLAEGYRSPQRQEEHWNQRLAIVRAENPQASQDQVERLTRLCVAQPTGRGGGHQTGGAVDVTLADAAGREIDMGTGVDEFTPRTPSFARELPPAVSRHRRLLIAAMHDEGFSNYPGEWWHFSYGDQMWAAYLRIRCAIYGPVGTESACQRGASD